MKNFLYIFTISAVLASFSTTLTGCSHCGTAVCDMLGISHSDLERARATGTKKEVPFTQAEAFDKVLKILEKNDIIIYQHDLKKGYIVAMGFPKQTDTTRVGIFFEPSGDGKTTITLSSLSTTALDKADVMILGGLDKLQKN